MRVAPKPHNESLAADSKRWLGCEATRVASPWLSHEFLSELEVNSRISPMARPRTGLGNSILTGSRTPSQRSSILNSKCRTDLPSFADGGSACPTDTSMWGASPQLCSRSMTPASATFTPTVRRPRPAAQSRWPGGLRHHTFLGACDRLIGRACRLVEARS
jgi:hypothetical protein